MKRNILKTLLVLCVSVMMTVPSASFAAVDNYEVYFTMMARTQEVRNTSSSAVSSFNSYRHAIAQRVRNSNGVAGFAASEVAKTVTDGATGETVYATKNFGWSNTEIKANDNSCSALGAAIAVGDASSLGVVGGEIIDLSDIASDGALRMKFWKSGYNHPAISNYYVVLGSLVESELIFIGVPLVDTDWYTSAKALGAFDDNGNYDSTSDYAKNTKFVSCTVDFKDMTSMNGILNDSTETKTFDFSKVAFAGLAVKSDLTNSSYNTTYISDIQILKAAQTSDVFSAEFYADGSESPLDNTSSGTITVKTNIPSTMTGKLVVAKYNTNKEMDFVKTFDTTDSASSEITITGCSATDTVKVLILDNFENIKPLADYAELKPAQ